MRALDSIASRVRRAATALYFFLTESTPEASVEVRQHALGCVASLKAPLAIGAIFTVMTVAVTIHLTDRLWPIGWMIFDLSLVVARITLLVDLDRHKRAFREWDHFLLMAGGLIWCVGFAIATYGYTMTRQPEVVLISGLVAAGVVSAAVVRNAATPRLAVIFMVLCTVPWALGVVQTNPGGMAWLLFLALAWTGTMLGLIFQNHRLLIRLISTEIDASKRAATDSLTGLPNRSVIVEIVYGESPAVLTERWQSLTVLCLDLDGFKFVNDEFGHLGGDALLLEASARISQSIRAGDIACRSGGDEFVAFLPSAARHEARSIALRIIQSMKAPFTMPDGQIAHISVSIGGASRLDVTRSIEMLLLKADVNLYEAKAAGKSSYCDEPNNRGRNSNLRYLGKS